MHFISSLLIILRWIEFSIAFYTLVHLQRDQDPITHIYIIYWIKKKQYMIIYNDLCHSTR